jgi:DNA-binding GntR family transcriptional regulator
MDQLSLHIDRVIVDAILSARLRPGTRLGEQALATLFDVSRTTVREALIRLETRGLIHASARRGWFVVEPSVEEVLEAFQARRAIETGMLRIAGEIQPQVIETLRAHIAQEREAIAANDIAARSYLLADFHVCMVSALQNHMLSEILRDLTARTILIAALYQSVHDASESCDEHERITDCLAAGDIEGAAAQMISHIGNVESGLTQRVDRDPMLDLRLALAHPFKRKDDNHVRNSRKQDRQAGLARIP